MESAVEQGPGQLEAVLGTVAVLSAAASGDAAGLLDVVAQIDGLCDRLAGVRMELLHGAELACEPGLNVAERLHATNRVSRPASRADVRLATRIDQRGVLMRW